MKKWGKRILAGGVALLAVLFGLIGWGLSVRPKHIPAPSSNGIDEMLRIAERLGSPKNHFTSDRQYSSQKASWLRYTPRFRAQMTNLLEMDFLVRNTYSNSISKRFENLKLTTALMQLEARLLAEAQDESVPTEERIYLCLQAYELAGEATRGGALREGMVSAAARIKSLMELSACSSNASSTQLKAAANHLARLVEQAPSLADYHDGEAFFYSTIPLKVKLTSWIENLKGEGRGNYFTTLDFPLEPLLAEMNLIEQSTLRDLAVRSYTMDKGSPPTNWSDLIPTYLPAPLVDPVGKTNLSLISGTTYKFSSE